MLHGGWVLKWGPRKAFTNWKLRSGYSVVLNSANGFWRKNAETNKLKKDEYWSLNKLFKVTVIISLFWRGEIKSSITDWGKRLSAVTVGVAEIKHPARNIWPNPSVLFTLTKLNISVPNYNHCNVLWNSRIHEKADIVYIYMCLTWPHYVCWWNLCLLGLTFAVVVNDTHCCCSVTTKHDVMPVDLQQNNCFCHLY